MAGYDPNAAVTFWQRMAASSNNQTSEFLSDHPSDATRISQIQNWLPEAQKYYKKPAATTATKSATTAKKATKTSNSGQVKTLKFSSKKK